MELLIKSRIFIFLYKIRKGLIDVKEDEIMELMIRREVRNVEQKYNEYNEIIDRMMFYKGMKDYVLFGCNKWENLELQGFKNKLKKELMEFQDRNWGNGDLLPRCYRWQEFGL